MDATPSLEPDLLGTPASFADPFPLYRHLRARSPVLHRRVLPGDEIQSYHALLEHADVSAALRDVETFCLGAPLARVEASVTLNLLLDRFPRLGRGPEPAVRQAATLLTFGYQRLPLVLA